MATNPFGDAPARNTDQGRETNPFGDVPAAQTRQINKPLQFLQKIAQGATFGFGDEISAAMVGGMAALTGGNFREAYDFALDEIRRNEEAFAAQNPKTALGAEMLGAITGGGLAGARLLGGGAMRGASLLGKTGRIAGVGAAEGALYGAGTAEEGERLGGAAKGGAVGAVAAPIGAAVIHGVLKGGRAAASYAGRKLADTPRSQAIRAIRQAALNEGIDADDAVRLLDELGPNATLADLGENFRYLARAATDQGGPFKAQARSLMNLRQAGQQDRLLRAAEVASGQRAGNFQQARQALLQSRKAASAPLYEEAFRQGIQETPELAELMTRPAMRSAMARATKMAADEGLDASGNLMVRLHYAKMRLDDMIGQAKRAGGNNQVRILTGLKNELLDQIDGQSPAYKQAREIFSGDSRMLDAMDVGAGLLKASPDDLREAVSGMTASERDLFRLGAVRALKDRLDNVGETHDATKRLLNTRAMRDRLSLVFDDPDEFIQAATRETEFSRTRNVLTGGSPTAERLAGQQDLAGAIQPELITDLLTGNLRSATGALLKVFSKHKVTPELVEELAGLMLQQGQSPDQVRRIFAQPALAQRLGRAYDDVVLPGIAGALAPASQAAQQ